MPYIYMPFMRIAARYAVTSVSPQQLPLAAVVKTVSTCVEAAGSSSSRQRYFSWEKRVVGGKTKYLPVKEALRLSCVDAAPPSKLTLHSRELDRSSNSRTAPLLSSCQDLVSPSKAPRQKSLRIPGGSLQESKAYAPASSVLWMGSFFVEGLNLRMEARPPSEVLQKICDLSSKIPQVLRFQQVPCEEIWNQFFRDCDVDARDVGLYFFPAEESRVCYSSLVNALASKKLALRNAASSSDVELCVFTSKLLPENLQREGWKGKCFLWGVFHRPVRVNELSFR
ncbi:hypothetical protein M569_07731 [Genlisea aurea]|uniref:AIPP2-like SPOC-like domain-containing protein n=1 Tax=Genlisea aurea TaxID=192259 RepID=S8CK29_9LAMI|nr:hypothetical protein M569_07731 [Genlisea aurea]